MPSWNKSRTRSHHCKDSLGYAEAQEVAERARRLSPAKAEHSGSSLVDMEIVDEDTGLGGRFLVQLMKHRRAPLPWTRLGVGSPVILSPDEFGGRAAPRSELRARFRAPHKEAAGYRDEACQSVEPGCWIPLLRCDRVVLAGDYCQLPPTVVFEVASSRIRENSGCFAEANDHRSLRILTNSATPRRNAQLGGQWHGLPSLSPKSPN